MLITKNYILMSLCIISIIIKMNIIEIKNLSLKYKENWIIKDLNICLKKGEILAVIGKSGVGKSSFLKSILSLEDYEGSIIKNSKNISYMPQDLALFEEKSVLYNISLPLKIKKKELNQEYLNKLMLDLEIKDILNKKVKNLSGGQKSRVALARSLILKDNIILLDEAFSKLDYFTKNNTIDMIQKIKIKYDLSIIYVTHDLNEVSKLANRVLILNKDAYIITENLEEKNLINNIT